MRKCKYCKVLDSEDNMVKVGRITKGSITLGKSGKPLYDYYHKECKANADATNHIKAFVGELYGPGKPFPYYIMKRLQPYMNYYGAAKLMQYLESKEHYLKTAKCNDSNHRLNLMVYMVQKEIDSFAPPVKLAEIPIKDIEFVSAKRNDFNDETFDLD